MKRLLLALAIIAFFCAGGHAQLRPTVKPQLMPYSYYQFPAYLQADSGILAPVRTPSFIPKRKGTFVYNPTDSTPHFWSGYSWFPLATQSWSNNLFYSTATFDTSSRVLSLVNGSGTTSLVIPRGGNVGGLSSLSYSRTADMINILGDNGASVRFSLRDADSTSRMLYSDTSAMLTGYGRSGQLVKYSDTAAMHTNLLRKSDTTAMLSGYGRSGQLVKYSDTSAMHTNLLRKSDTTAMLSGYGRSGQLVKYSDTAAQLSGYGRSGQLVKYSDTAAQLSGYARSGQVVKYSDTSVQLSNYRRKTTVIENSDLRNSTISGVSLGNSLNLLSWGYGLTSGTSYNGSAAVTQGVDTAAMSTKANVTALLLGKQPLLSYTPENAANKGAANGYAPLGSDVKIATTYLPAITMNNAYSASSQSAMLALSSAVVGDMCVRTDSTITYVLQVAAPSNPAAWLKLQTPVAPVSSVNGKTGAVSLLTSDIAEGGTSYYWTAARSRAAQSSSIAAISYDNGTGTFSLVAGYYIPSTTDQSNWNVAYNRRLSSASLSASTLTLTLADASTVTASVPTWNQNTTGNAATASNSTLWNGQSLDYSTGVTTAPTFVTGFSSGSTRIYTAAAIQSFVGLNTSNWVDIPTTQTITGAKTFSSQITSNVTSGYVTYNLSGGTGSLSHILQNSGGSYVSGIASSTGSFFSSGGNAYATSFGNYTSTPIQFGTNNIVRYTIDASGNNTWTGNGSFGGLLTVGPILNNTNALTFNSSNTAKPHIGTGFASTFLQHNTYYNGSSQIFDDNTAGSSVITMNDNIFFQTGVPGVAPYTKVIITQAGYLGIGNTSPANTLQVGDIGTTGFGGNQAAFGNGTNALAIGIDNTSPVFYSNVGVRFFTAGSLALTLSNTQAGTFANSVTATAFINSNYNNSYVLLGGGGALAYSSINTASTIMYRDASGSFAAYSATISSSVTASAFYESSDIRLKRLHIIENSKDGINAIQYTFRPSGTDKWGYSAQQVRKILPYAVTTGEDGFLKVDYTTVHTFKIMKLEKRIEELEQLTRKLMLQQIQSPKGN